MKQVKDQWNSSGSYELFMGRWSKLMAPEFLKWLNLPTALNWMDIGCGTGALSEAILQYSKPSDLVCIDPSEEFLMETKERVKNNAKFFISSAETLPVDDNTADVIVSGLALNFFPDPESAVAEMKRKLKPGGIAAAYVWDYADRMHMLRFFWDGVMLIDSKSRHLDEGIRFPICNPDKLKDVFISGGFSDVQVANLNIITLFNNFDDYWNPFLGGQGPAPGYLSSLTKEKQELLKKEIFNKLHFQPDGSIKMLAGAIAVKGKKI